MQAQWAANTHGGNARETRENAHISGQRDISGQVIGQLGAQEPVNHHIPHPEMTASWQWDLSAKGGRVLNQELRDKESNKLGSMRMHGAGCLVQDARNLWEVAPDRVPNQRGYF